MVRKLIRNFSESFPTGLRDTDNYILSEILRDVLSGTNSGSKRTTTVDPYTRAESGTVLLSPDRQQDVGRGV